MERHYRFAGVEICISMPEELFYTNEYHLAPFAVDRCENPILFSFEKQEKLDPPSGACLIQDPGFRIYSDGSNTTRYIGTVSQSWENAYIRVEGSEKKYHVQVCSREATGRIGTKTVLNAIGGVHLIARAGGFVFHCSYIDHNGKAILFTAPSGTGKSTQAELWNALRGAEIINGDRAAVRILDGTAMAEGIPFAGSSRYCKNHCLPIEAIVYLGQAPQTTIRKMKGFEAFARIWEGCSVNTWDKEDLSLVSGVVKHLAENVPVYHLLCTPDESAVIASENILKNR